METTYREYTCTVQLENLRAWLTYSEARQEWTVEVYLRLPGGVQFLERRYSGDMPSDRVLVADAARLGWQSYRPSKLGDAFDPSMAHPVLALFLHYCWWQKCDAEQILRSAFPSLEDDLRVMGTEISAQATWEGTEYPDDWSSHATVGRLLVALDQVGYRTLADALQHFLIDGG